MAERRTSQSTWQRAAGGATIPVGGSATVQPAELLAILRRANSRPIQFAPVPYDVLAQCPNCKTVETLQFVGRTLTPSRKFYQKEGRVYHDCGSAQPCRLHR